MAVGGHAVARRPQVRRYAAEHGENSLGRTDGTEPLHRCTRKLLHTKQLDSGISTKCSSRLCGADVLMASGRSARESSRHPHPVETELQGCDQVFPDPVEAAGSGAADSDHRPLLSCRVSHPHHVVGRAPASEILNNRRENSHQLTRQRDRENPATQTAPTRQSDGSIKG